MNTSTTTTSIAHLSTSVSATHEGTIIQRVWHADVTVQRPGRTLTEHLVLLRHTDPVTGKHTYMFVDPDGHVWDLDEDAPQLTDTMIAFLTHVTPHLLPF